MFFPIYTSLIPIPLYAGAYFLTPENLYFFPERFLANHPWVDFFNGLCLYGLLCIGFIDFLIAAVTQPFSADILVISYSSEGKGKTFGEILKMYSNQSGLRHIFKKRYDFLLQGAYVVEKDKEVMLTSKGQAASNFARILKRWS